MEDQIKFVQIRCPETDIDTIKQLLQECRSVESVVDRIQSKDPSTMWKVIKPKNAQPVQKNEPRQHQPRQHPRKPAERTKPQKETIKEESQQQKTVTIPPVKESVWSNFYIPTAVPEPKKETPKPAPVVEEPTPVVEEEEPPTPVVEEQPKPEVEEIPEPVPAPRVTLLRLPSSISSIRPAYRNFGSFSSNPLRHRTQKSKISIEETQSHHIESTARGQNQGTQVEEAESQEQTQQPYFTLPPGAVRMPAQPNLDPKQVPNTPQFPCYYIPYYMPMPPGQAPPEGVNMPQGFPPQPQGFPPQPQGFPPQPHYPIYFAGGMPNYPQPEQQKPPFQ